MPRIAKKQVNRGNTQADSPKTYYIRVFGILFIDKLISEIELKFAKLSHSASRLLKKKQQRYVSKSFRVTKTGCNSTCNIMRMRNKVFRSTTPKKLVRSIHEHKETLIFIVESKLIMNVQ